ncbi:MAG TPA: DUF4157 domain-containing protein [Polyangia bacterium]|nr:DUF4157 domain-containing protein [Polyangia bacterium]
MQQKTEAAQARSDGTTPGSEAEQVHDAAALGTQGPSGALPYLGPIQQAFGRHDVSHVKAHTDDQAAAGARAMGAEAFAMGEHVAFAGTPSLHTAAHEAAHVIQQRAGVHLKGGVGEVGDAYEQQADRVADRVVAGQSAEAALDQMTGVGQAPGAPRAADHAPVQRKAAEYKKGSDIQAMTLVQFERYAQDQADWATGAEVGAAKDDLRSLLELARKTPAFLAGCAKMKVQELASLKLDPTAPHPLLTYCRAVKKEIPTVEVAPTASLTEAIDFGKALDKLNAGPGGVTMKHIMKQTGDHPQLKALMDAGAVDDFIAYAANPRKPALQADDGSEIRSFIKLHKEVGPDPATHYNGALPQVRNLHRFESAALDRLKLNEGVVDKAKPFTLILHSALDHNGAFQRDANLTAAIKNDKNLTLMIEGKETLDEVSSQLEPLAKKYGQGDKIDQVMFAGHGSARSIELAGKVVEKGGKLKQKAEDVDLDTNETETYELFDKLLENMDPTSPNHRVVFNACLTNSNAVEGPLSSDPAKARKQIKKAIRDNGSLATTLTAYAKDQAGKEIKGVGANASISSVELMNQKTGALDIKTADDPKVTAPKIEYVEFGTEPEGVMRAVVECWANDKTSCIAAMRRRVSNPAGDEWEPRLIHTYFTIILNKNQDNAELMNQFADGASAIAEAADEDECSVENISREVPDAHLPAIYASLRKTSAWKSEPFIPLVFLQEWMRHDGSKKTSFLEHLGQYFTCHAASRFVDLDALEPLIEALLPKSPFKTPPKGQRVLALLFAAQGKAGGRVTEFLKAVVGSRSRFPPSFDIDTLLDGLATENEILAAIGLGVNAPKGKEPNIDVDRNGQNDLYVTPMTRRAKIKAETDARDKADDTGGSLGKLAKDAVVHTIGSTEDKLWLAIEHGARIGFVKTAEVELL